MHVLVTADEGNVAVLQAFGDVSVADIKLYRDEVVTPFTDLLGSDAYRRRVCLDLSRLSRLPEEVAGWFLDSCRRFRREGGLLVIYSIPRAIDERYQLMLNRECHLVQESLAVAKQLAATLAVQNVHHWGDEVPGKSGEPRYTLIYPGKYDPFHVPKVNCYSSLIRERYHHIDRMSGAFGRWGYDESEQSDRDSVKTLEDMLKDGLHCDLAHHNQSGEVVLYTFDPLLAAKYGLQREKIGGHDRS